MTEGVREPLVTVNDVTVRFPVQTSRGRQMLTAVRSVSLDILPGDIVALVGESGSGKSTLGKAILRIVPVSEGSVTYDGRDLSELKGAQLRRARRGMQAIFQDPGGSLNRRLTVGRNLARVMRLAGERSRRVVDERIRELMGKVNLPEDLLDRYPNQISGGQRQRVSIAQALATNPKFIVCDEPLSALDVSVQAQIVELLDSLRHDFGLTYLFVSHDLAVVSEFADSVQVMYAGRIVESAPTQTLFSEPVHPYTHALLSAAPMPDPELERNRARIVLGGEPPDPLVETAGCPFARRCAFAVEKCRSETPRTEEVSEGHAVACHRWQELTLSAKKRSGV